jgi:hypothetical protein
MCYARCALVFVSVLAVLSCSPPEDKNPTLLSEAALDGYVTWLASVSNDTYTGSASDASVNIGDPGNDTDVTRCVVSFDLSSLPAGAQIQSAVLRMYQNADSNGGSYSETVGLGVVLVDNISYASFVPDANFFSVSIGANIGTLATSFSANTWHEPDVTTSALDEVNLTHSGRLQFRIYHHYENNNDFIADTDGWVMGDSSTNQTELVITLK